MKDYRHYVLALAAALTLSGCVIVISDEGISTADGVHVNDNSRDRALAGRVRDAFAADDQLKDADITVAARDGVVTLRGDLVRVADLERAIDLTKRTEGVDKVVSRLRLELR
jgi:osmotically-inducible protein OsmY